MRESRRGKAGRAGSHRRRLAGQHMYCQSLWPHMRRQGGSHRHPALRGYYSWAPSSVLDCSGRSRIGWQWRIGRAFRHCMACRGGRTALRGLGFHPHAAENRSVPAAWIGICGWPRRGSRTAICASRVHGCPSTITGWAAIGREYGVTSGRRAMGQRQRTTHPISVEGTATSTHIRDTLTLTHRVPICHGVKMLLMDL